MSTQLSPSGVLSWLRGPLSGADRIRDFGIVVAAAVLFFVLSVSSSAFLTQANLLNLLEQNAPIGIMACAGAFVLIAGGLDLSVGAIFTLAAVLGSKLALEAPTGVAVLAGVMIGGGLGLINGLIVTWGRVNAFITTITTAVIFAGTAQIVTGGSLVSPTSPSFAEFGSAEVFGIDLAIVIFVVVACLAAVLLNLTSFGRRVFAVGGNREAARLSGVRVGPVRAMTFGLSGFAAGLAGMLVATRTSTASVSMGVSVEFDVIAAMLVGGISVQGGEGAIWRAVIGVLLLAMIDNGLTLLHVEPTYQNITKGGIILAALVIDARSRRLSRVGVPTNVSGKPKQTNQRPPWGQGRRKSIESI